MWAIVGIYELPGSLCLPPPEDEGGDAGGEDQEGGGGRRHRQERGRRRRRRRRLQRSQVRGGVRRLGEAKVGLEEAREMAIVKYVIITLYRYCNCSLFIEFITDDVF